MSAAKYFHGSLEDAKRRAKDIFFLCKDCGCDECHNDGRSCDALLCHHTSDILHAKHRFELESREHFVWELVRWIDKTTGNKNVALFEYEEDYSDER